MIEQGLRAQNVVNGNNNSSIKYFKKTLRYIDSSL